MKKIVLFLCLLGFLNFANSEWTEITDGLTDEALNSVTGLAKDSDGNVYAGVAGVEGNGLYKFDFDNNSWEKIIGSPTYGSTQNPHIVQGSDGNDYVYSRSHILNLSDIDSGWSRPEKVPDEIVEKYDPKEYSDAERLQTHFYMQTVTAGEGRFLVASRKGNQILLTYDPVTKEWEDLNFPHKKTRGRLREVDGVIFYTTRDEGLFAYQNGEWTRITNNRRVFRGEVVSEHSGMAFGWNGNADDREIYYSYTPVNATQITSDRVLKMDGYTFSEETSGTWEERDTGGRFPSHVLVDSSREEYNRGSGYAFGCRPLLDIAYCVDGRFGGYFKLENGTSQMPDYTKSLPVSLGDTSLRVGDSVASGNDMFFLIRYNDEKTLKKMTFDENTHSQIATNFDTDYSSYLESKNPKGGAVLENGDILIGGNLDDQSYLFEYNSNYELQNQRSLTGDLVHMQGSINNKYTGILTTQKLYLYEDGNKAWAFDISDKNILVNDYGNDKQQKNRISVGDDGKIALLYDKNIAVFEDEEIIYEEYFGKTYANDIAINSDKNHIYVTGYQQFNNLQVAVIFAYEIGKEGIIWDTWNFNRDELSATENMADTRGYRITLGHNGDLYFAGESAGGNTIFRWNGKDLTTGTLNGGDMYNASWGISGAAHLGYLGRIDTNNGEVIQGQIIVPRLSNGNGNTFRSKYGEINIDNDGNVVFMATSACCGPNRDFLSINGERLGNYIGADNILYVTDETLNERILWTSLSANNYGEEQGKSVSRGVLVGNDVFYVLNEVEDGEVFTTNNANISSRNKEGQSQIVQVQLGESTRVFDFDGEDTKEEHKSIAINNISTTDLIKYNDSEINVDIDLENVSNNDVLEIHLKSSVDDDQVFADKILSLDSGTDNISANLGLSGVESYDLDNMILDVSVYDDYKGWYSDVETLNIDFQQKYETKDYIKDSYDYNGWDNGGVNRDDFNVIEANSSNYTDKVSDLEPGDWLELAPGNYTNNLSISNMHGTEEEPIVISGPQDGTATFERQSGSNTIQISGSSYVVLKDFDMNGGGSGRRGDAIQPRSSASHHIVIEGLHIYDYSNRIALNTNNVPLWDWILRDNVIENKSTGIYIGDASGDGEAFVGGLLEGNVFKDTTGYNMQIKHQNYRDDVDGMPQDTRQTIIRNNTFKDAGDGRFRPNLLLGHFPSSGAGSDDMYLVYNNLFYNNHAGHRNVQTDSTVAFYNNIFANNNGGGIFVTDHNNNPKDIYIFRNTFHTDSTAVQIRGVNTDYEQIVKGNAVFANTPFSLYSNVEESDNFTRYYNEVSNYIDNTNYEPINDELKKGSINYGIELEDFDIDYKQNPRYVATYGAVSFDGGEEPVEPIEPIEPEIYEVRFNLNPEDLNLIVKDKDDVTITSENNIYNVQNGVYTYIASLDGYFDEEYNFEVDGENKEIQISLESKIEKENITGGTRIREWEDGNWGEWEISCDSGYRQSGDSCVRRSSGGGGGSTWTPPSQTSDDSEEAQEDEDELKDGEDIKESDPEDSDIEQDTKDSSKDDAMKTVSESISESSNSQEVNDKLQETVKNDRLRDTLPLFDRAVGLEKFDKHFDGKASYEEALDHYQGMILSIDKFLETRDSSYSQLALDNYRKFQNSYSALNDELLTYQNINNLVQEESHEESAQETSKEVDEQVDEDKQIKDIVDYFVNVGVVSEDVIYKLNENVTRQELAQVIKSFNDNIRLVDNKRAGGCYIIDLSDVLSKNRSAVSWACGAGLMSTSNNNFNPDRYLIVADIYANLSNLYQEAVFENYQDDNSMLTYERLLTDLYSIRY